MQQYNQSSVNGQEPKLNEIKLFPRTATVADIYVFTEQFKRGKQIGMVDTERDTFRSIPRDRNNLFHLFRNRKRTSGLGLNNELLQKVKFTFIEIPFEGRVLKTTKEHFMEKSIPSPYHNGKVDFQKILQIKDFVVPEVDTNEDVVLSLFKEVS